MMGKRNRRRESIDPEEQRWAAKYPRFPGVAECARLIRAGKARGTWADIIAHELADHAQETLPELIAEFERSEDDEVRLYILMALEIACLPESVGFLSKVIRSENQQFADYARRTLTAIDTRESRTIVFEASQAKNEAS